ncbi:lipopolysaccharide biosynthesis protein [Lactiplantibacillus songbeiensis]|uniref:Lipopolysaccharide biosynthesis protein n=1 Tax=Lactiplantibacillus songbeiensis TaxID=2559920 RepID=A0ABW4C6C5_9LACO|nr:lipopolysaccharide biosynthesis protein [Lactiplantibacillus songbeiensis]
MKNESNRTKAASLNAVTILVTQILSLLLRFGVQTAFIHELSQNYLGLNGLFSNIISFLSFADLGIGTAITVALYEPIADRNIKKLRVLINFYRKTYLIIILVVFIIGLGISPWIYLFIKKPVFSNFQLTSWFLLYLLSTLATYFSANKRSFLMATQQGYLNSLNDFVFKAVQQTLQILVLVFFHSFLWFLILQVGVAILGNWQISKVADSRYPNVFLKNNLIWKNHLDSVTMKSIKHNVVGAISSKVGSIIVFGTDNLILSTFVGLMAVAKYSNYMLIVQSISSVFSQVMGSIVGSIGNLHVTAPKERQKAVLYQLLYMNMLINLFVSVGLSFAINGFISVWAGNDYLLSTNITIGIVLNYSITQSRYAAQCFISGMGLYWSLRWKSLIEAAINLFLSLFFVQVLNFGIMGVILGTLGSNILVNIIWEPYIVFYDGGLGSPKMYLFKYTCYEIYIIVVIVVLSIISPLMIHAGLVKLFFYTVIVEIVSITIFMLLTLGLPEFHYFFNVCQNFYCKVKSKLLRKI